MITYHTLTTEEKKTICNWRYIEEYSIYNYPVYEEALKESLSLVDSLKKDRYTGYYDNDILIGFTSFKQMNDVYIGIGVNPSYLNQGYGTEIMKIALELCKERFSNQTILLEVRTFNKRAIHCYEKNGFSIEKKYKRQTPTGINEFYLIKLIK